MPVLAPGHVKLHQFWAHAPDDRPWVGPAPPAVAYVFAGGRSKKEIASQLSGFTGILQVDGYAAYKALVKDRCAESRITLAFCLALARRKFVGCSRRRTRHLQKTLSRRSHGLCDREAHSREKRLQAARYPAG